MELLNLFHANLKYYLHICMVKYVDYVYTEIS